MNYLCIHCHFYQPPRENPWLEQIELQDSAYPYHDWNERISAECYGPNLAARILDDQQYITRIVNNYTKISFNYGPTLLSWAAEHSPEMYDGILNADKQSQKIFSGHGSAVAQGYNHMIMPLANSRDKLTQIRWGIEDFRSRFGRLARSVMVAGNSRRYRIARSHGAMRHRLCHPRSSPSESRAPLVRWGLARCERV